MDSIDKAILGYLQRDASAPVGEIADAVGLSQTPCWRRIKKLEEDGVIRRVALADRAALNLKLTAFVAVKTADHSDAWLAEFADKVRRVPEVVELHRMSGETDYLMKVVCPDMESFDAVYKKLISTAAFSDVTSTFSMEQLKDTTEMPLDYT
ncbi:MAG: Lrp/AsnC family transcriptional regulator [Pseudomonadota bacterium]